MLTWDPVNTYGQHWLKLHGVEIVLVTEAAPPIRESSPAIRELPKSGTVVPR